MNILKYSIVICIFLFSHFALADGHMQKYPTIVLVHGALLTSTIWAPVQSDLQNHGHNVVTVDTPGRVNDLIKPKDATLIAAAEKVCKVIAMQDTPVLLVGHSQAGAVITQATNICGQRIKGLVYVAAAPSTCESIIKV